MLSVILVFLDVKKDWNNVFEILYFIILIAGPVIGIIITLLFIIVTCIKKARRRNIATQIEPKEIVLFRQPNNQLREEVGLKVLLNHRTKKCPN
jgi:hypothetical protein